MPLAFLLHESSFSEYGWPKTFVGSPRGRPGTLSLRILVRSLTPKARSDLRRVLIHDQADCDAIASRLLRYPRRARRRLADIIDMLTMHPEARRQLVRLLGGDRGSRLVNGDRVPRTMRTLSVPG